MVAAVAPFIDTSISKTVNVPADYPYADFQGLYLQRVEVGPEGPGDLPAERGARRGAQRRRGRSRAAATVAGDDANQRLRARAPAGAGAGVAALAEPPRACPAATRRGAT